MLEYLFIFLWLFILYKLDNIIIKNKEKSDNCSINTTYLQRTLIPYCSPNCYTDYYNVNIILRNNIILGNNYDNNCIKQISSRDKLFPFIMKYINNYLMPFNKDTTPQNDNIIIFKSIDNTFKYYSLIALDYTIESKCKNNIIILLFNDISHEHSINNIHIETLISYFRENDGKLFNTISILKIKYNKSHNKINTLFKNKFNIHIIKNTVSNKIIYKKKKNVKIMFNSGIDEIFNYSRKIRFLPKNYSNYCPFMNYLSSYTNDSTYIKYISNNGHRKKKLIKDFKFSNIYIPITSIYNITKYMNMWKLNEYIKLPINIDAVYLESEWDEYVKSKFDDFRIKYKLHAYSPGEDVIIN